VAKKQAGKTAAKPAKIVKKVAPPKKVVVKTEAKTIKVVKKESVSKKPAAKPLKKVIAAKAIATKKVVPSKKPSEPKTPAKKIVAEKVTSAKKDTKAAPGITGKAGAVSVSEKKETTKAGGILSVRKESQKPSAHGNEIKAILLKNREELLKEIIESRVRESDSLKRDVGDIYDDASSERDRELSLLLGDRDRQKLIEIDDALQRIESGEYGVCESCGERIAPGRIKAQPFTKLCINCKAEEERQEARQKKFEAEGVFRNINYSEEEEG